MKQFMTEYICPHCGKPIYDDEALLCLYCGENLQRDVGVFGKIRYASHGMIFVLVIVIVLISFLVLMVF